MSVQISVAILGERLFSFIAFMIAARKCTFYTVTINTKLDYSPHDNITHKNLDGNAYFFYRLGTLRDKPVYSRVVVCSPTIGT